MATILVVEDDNSARQMFRAALTLAGFRVIEARDGLHALRRLDADLLDLVVLDLGLPIISGEVVREEIAAHDHTRRIPVVIVTGRPGPHDQLDAACVLVKPVGPDQLVKTVQYCLSSGSAVSSA